MISETALLPKETKVSGRLASYDSATPYKNERQLFPELAGESPFIERLLLAQQ